LFFGDAVAKIQEKLKGKLFCRKNLRKMVRDSYKSPILRPVFHSIIPQIIKKCQTLQKK
jgi:hypothetical protein